MIIILCTFQHYTVITKCVRAKILSLFILIFLLGNKLPIISQITKCILQAYKYVFVIYIGNKTYCE